MLTQIIWLVFSRWARNENYFYNSSNPINCTSIGQEAGVEFFLIQCSFVADNVFWTSILVLLSFSNFIIIIFEFRRVRKRTRSRTQLIAWSASRSYPVVERSAVYHFLRLTFICPNYDFRKCDARVLQRRNLEERKIHRLLLACFFQARRWGKNQLR